MILTNSIAIEGLIKEIINDGEFQNVTMESGENAIYKKQSPKIPESLIGERAVLSCKFVPNTNSHAHGHLLIENVYVSLKSSGQDVIREAIKTQIKQKNSATMVPTGENIGETALIEEQPCLSVESPSIPIANRIRAKINEKIETLIESHPRMDPEEIELIEPSVRREKTHEDDIVMSPVLAKQSADFNTNDKKIEAVVETKLSEAQTEAVIEEEEKKPANPFTSKARELLPNNKKKSLLPTKAEPNKAAVLGNPRPNVQIKRAEEVNKPEVKQAAPETQKAAPVTNAFTPSPVLGKRPALRTGSPALPSRQA